MHSRHLYMITVCVSSVSQQWSSACREWGIPWGQCSDDSDSQRRWGKKYLCFARVWVLPIKAVGDDNTAFCMFVLCLYLYMFSTKRLLYNSIHLCAFHVVSASDPQFSFASMQKNLLIWRTTITSFCMRERVQIMLLYAYVNINN